MSACVLSSHFKQMCDAALKAAAMAVPEACPSCLHKPCPTNMAMSAHLEAQRGLVDLLEHLIHLFYGLEHTPGSS